MKEDEGLKGEGKIERKKIDWKEKGLLKGEG